MWAKRAPEGGKVFVSSCANAVIEVADAVCSPVDPERTRERAVTSEQGGLDPLKNPWISGHSWVDRTCDELEWAPRTSLREGVARLCGWIGSQLGSDERRVSAA